MDFIAVKRSRKCSGFVIYSYLKGTCFAESLTGEASQKQSLHHATHDISKAFGEPTKGLLIKVNHNVQNELWKMAWRFKIKCLRLTSAFLSSPNCFTFADTFSVYTAGVHTTKTMSSAVSQRFWNKNPAWHSCTDLNWAELFFHLSTWKITWVTNVLRVRNLNCRVI